MVAGFVIHVHAARISIVLCFGVFAALLYPQYASAETYSMYVERMPQHWQKQFDGMLEEATNYWSEQNPKIKFETVQFVDRSDFVVQWSSNQEEKLGYYSAETANAYGKPTVVITLGFFADKQLKMVPYEHALLLTKHELGHAIGMTYNDDPASVMYPTIEDFESLQSVDVSVPASGNLEQLSKKYQNLVEEKLLSLQPQLIDAHKLLNSESPDGLWMSFWWAKKYLADAEALSVEGGAAILQSNFEDSYTKFKTAHEYANRAEQKISQITTSEGTT
ncbi:MAG: matrixin family metalloprotease [Thermoproteota archaeon]